ncbi:MAG: sigma-54-dependent transcriptional regulator [bacterium]
MSKKSHSRILIVDDEQAITQGLSELLKEEGFITETVADGKKALSMIEKNPFELVLLDLMIPGLTGLELLAEIKKREFLTEVIIITGKGTIHTAVEAMKSHAYDYLTKPVEPIRLRAVVAKALEHQSLIKKTQRLEQKIKSMTRYEDMVGHAEKMQQIYRLIDAVADTTASVLITGESGTGKELVARAMHKKSSRAAGPFIAVNCSAFPHDILENELFGHEKGAFTGALSEKAGCFEMANGGTLFLDEIGEMPADTQAKLLRALEERSFRRLGGSKEVKVDVRVLAATNKDTKKALQEGTLREDLYFRLSVMEIEMPPLRERMSDLKPLLTEFLNHFNEKHNKQVSGFSKECYEIFSTYPWPGNVRELKNLVERAVILCTDKEIEVKHLPKLLTSESDKSAGDSESIVVGKTLYEIEKEVIFKTLQLTDNNKTQAAQMLGISLKTMHNKLNKYYLEKEVSKR